MTTQTGTYPQAQEDLITIQLRLEEEMTFKGAQAFMQQVSSAVEHGREDGVSHGMTILKGRLNTLSSGFNKWLTEAGAGVVGLRSNIAYKKVKGTSPDLLAYITLRNIVAGLSQTRALQAVAISIGTALEDELRLAAIRAEDKNIYDSIVKGAKKRTSQHYKHVYAARRADYANDGWNLWTTAERLHVGLKLIHVCIDTVGLIEITEPVSLGGKRKSTRFIAPTKETLEWIEKKNSATSFLRPVYEPMVVKPKDWTNPRDGGYLSSNVKPLTLVKSNNKAYLEDLEHTDMPIVYEAVNALQRTAWQINTKVLEVMKQLWTANSELAGVPSKEPMDLPVKPDDIETNEEARRAYRAEAATVHLLNLQSVSKRVSFETTLDIASRYVKYRQIYMPYTLDFRGRIYAVPHLNPQGNDIQKSLLRFANGKPLGSEGWKWLAIHGANVIGNDKVTFEDRVNFILDNEEEIVAIAQDPYANRGWCGSIGGVKVDKPWQTLAFCFEWAGYCELGEAFVSKIPVALDGSCSGIQHFSAMLRDESGGAAVNLTPSELPADVYGLVAARVKEQMVIDMDSGSPDELKHAEDGTPYLKRGTKSLAEQWNTFGVSRKTTKRSVMTLAYGSAEYGFKEQLMEDILTPARLGGEPFPFDGDGYGAAAYMAKLIWVAVNRVLVKAGEAMKWLQESATLAAKENLPVRWTTAVGFPVMQAYEDLKDRLIHTAIAGRLVQMRVREANKDLKLDSRAQRNGIAPNFVHSTDAAHLMLTTVRAKQNGITSFAMIHDSFGALAADIDGDKGLYEVVRESFVEMYSEIDVLTTFREDVCGLLSPKSREKLPQIPAKGSLQLEQIRDSRYCFS